MDSIGKKLNIQGINLAIILGSAVGLWSYFSIGWFIASLVAATVSFVITMLSAKISPDSTDWNNFKKV